MILMLAMLLLFAEDPPAQPPAGGGSPFNPILMFLPIVALMIFMMYRNSRRQANEQQTMLSTLEKNDKVLTHAMIYGTIVSVNPNEDEVTIRVDDNTRLKMTKSAIARNITKEQARAAAAATAAANKAGAATPPPAPVPAPQTGVTEKPTT
jgi:preprotein translocase subunit YajC